MRISGITIPEQKRIEYGLTAVYGIGLSRAQKILQSLKIDTGIRPKDLTTEQENAIRKEVESFTIEGDLKRQVSANIKRLKDVVCYRGTRHAKKLPVRGQRTKTNSRTVRGNVRKTMGSGRRVLTKT